MKIKGKRVVTEFLNANAGFFYTVNKTLLKKKTRYQKMELVDTNEFGTVLLLDGITQVVESNDYQYHEPMVHPALIAHPAPEHVLIIGGGDGGIIREVAKYPCVKRMVIAELDGDVIEFSKKHLSAVHGNAFADPRVETYITDGRTFVESSVGEFDVVIMDMTDPFGPSKMLYTKEFFRAVKKSLRGPEGIFVMHSESPVMRPVAFNSIHTTLNSVFNTVCPFYMYIQMYATLWSMAVASNSSNCRALTASQVDKKLAHHGITNLKLYTGATHVAMQVAYPYLTDILEKKTRVITDAQPDFPDNFIKNRK